MSNFGYSFMTNQKTIKTIFFDLGNVLIDFDHTLMWNQLSKACETQDTNLQNIIYKNHLWDQYEKGLINTKAFIDEIENFLKNPICHDKFISAASEIFSPNLEMKKILEKLHKNGYELFLISNTCDIHFNYIKRRFPIMHFFKEILLSYELHLIKPELDIFKHALSLTHSKPSECMFIDDLAVHVEAAKSLGIVSHIFKNAKKLKKTLHENGINI